MDEKASGTNGGTFTAGAWRTRDLNTEVADTGNHASVASNQITLAAGTYRVRAAAHAYSVQANRIRLRDVTNGVTLATGLNTKAVVVTGIDAGGTISVLSGRFKLTAQAVIELQHYCVTTKTTSGFGLPLSSGDVERYAYVELERESA